MTPFAAELARLRSAHGFSLRQLGRRAYCSGQLIAYLERGQRTPSPQTAEALDRALDEGGALAALAAPADPDLPLWTPAMTPERGQPLGDEDAAALRSTLGHLVGLDIALGSDGLVPVATRAYRTAADRLAVHGTRGSDSDIRSAIADLGICASWVAADAVEHATARAVGIEALVMAELAGDTRLRRFLLSHLSMLAEHGGRGAEALAYADRALAEDPGDPRVQAMFSVRRARALSLLGADDQAVAAWERAEQLLGHAGPEDHSGLTYWLHGGELAIHRAVIETRAGRPEAVEWGQRGVELLPDAQGRDQVLFRAMLLHDAVAARAWPEAEAAARELLAMPAARSRRVPAVIRTAWSQAGRAPAEVRAAIRACLDALA